MGPSLRRIDPGVVEALKAHPYRFEFFQAVRVLLAYQRHSVGNASNEDLTDPSAIIRFRTALSLAFPASEIDQLVPRENETIPKNTIGTWEMVVNFMGMVGPSGVLPHHYTERLLERKIYHKDTAAHAFLDIFSHRLITLFFGAYKKYRLPIEYELSPEDRRKPKVSAFFGMGLPVVQNRFDADGSRVTVESLSFHAGLFTQRSRSGGNLVQILEAHFGVPFTLDQFVGRWIELADEQCTTLGGLNSSLDSSAMIGNRVWDRQITSGLRIGPLTRKQFMEFLPGGEAASELKKLLGFFTGISLDYKIKLLLMKEEIIPAQVGGCGVTPPRLGWDSWVLSEKANQDSDGAGYMIAA